MKTQVETEVDTKVKFEDVDDIIEIAARMKDAESDLLTEQDIKDVALELELEPRYVERAIKALELRRKKAKREKRKEKKQRRTVILGAAALVGLFCLVFGVTAFSVEEGLQVHQVVMAQKYAQVVNVIERQKALEEKLKGLPLDKDREAEVLGAEARVRVERRRYDEAVTQYNLYAGSFKGRFGVILFSHPAKAPFSHEVASW